MVTAAAPPRWADVDLGAIAGNTQLVKTLVGPATAVMAVVKANGYGHGAVPAARAAIKGGARWLGVSSIEEGLELRDAGLTVPILNLGYTPPPALAEAVAADLSLTIYEAQSLRLLQELSLPKPARIQVKVDTGMHRLGATPQEAMALVKAVRTSRGLQLEGLWTHFADAEGDPEFTSEQLRRFRSVREMLEREGAGELITHAANSAALLRYPESRLDLVRAGLVLYGVRAGRNGEDVPGLRPALSWRARVTNVQTVPAGESVGYGRTFRPEEPRRIATLAVGYADGLQRRHSNRGQVVVRGRAAPIVGLVSMDQTTVDVTDIPGVTIGDVASLLGSDGEAGCTAEAMAAAIDTIPYEVLCAISARVPRRYSGL